MCSEGRNEEVDCMIRGGFLSVVSVGYLAGGLFVCLFVFVLDGEDGTGAHHCGAVVLDWNSREMKMMNYSIVTGLPVCAVAVRQTTQWFTISFVKPLNNSMAVHRKA